MLVFLFYYNSLPAGDLLQFYTSLTCLSNGWVLDPST